MGQPMKSRTIRLNLSGFSMNMKWLPPSFSSKISTFEPAHLLLDPHLRLPGHDTHPAPDHQRRQRDARDDPAPVLGRVVVEERGRVLPRHLEVLLDHPVHLGPGVGLREHAPDESLGRLDPVRAGELVDRRVEGGGVEDRARVLLLLGRPPRIRGDHRHLIHEDQLRQAVLAPELPVAPHDGAAHGVPHERDVGQIPGDEQILDVLRQPLDGVAVVGLVGFPVAAHVHRDHAVAVAEAAQLMLELGGGL